MKTVEEYIDLLKQKIADTGFALEDALEYLKEEHVEISKREKEISWKQSAENRNNLVIPWLDGLCPPPTRLRHQYTDADLPDIDCLGQDTKVVVYNNRVKRIKDVLVGDTVLDSCGYWQSVVAVQRRKPRKDESIYSIKWSDGTRVIASENHRFYCSTTSLWHTVKEMKYMCKFTSHSQTVIQIDTINYRGYLYDITVDDSGNFKLANGVISHNCDFSPEWREKLKEYLRNQYGEKNCIEVGTFHTPTVKTMLLDLGRLYKVPQSETFEATKEISHFDINDHNSGKITVADLALKYSKLNDYFKKYPEIRQVIEEFKGVIRQIGVHASAFIISPKRVDEHIPIIRKTGGGYVTGHSENAGSKDLSSQSFIKMDLLGLCLKGGSLIDTDVGQKKIEDLTPFYDRVLYRANNGNIKATDKFSVFYRGKKKMKRVTLKSGKILFMTNDHMIRVKG